MTFKRSTVRKLFYRLGFTEAPNWDDDKLRVMSQELPKRIREDQIPKKYQELFTQLAWYSKKGEFIVWGSDAKLETDQ